MHELWVGVEMRVRWRGSAVADCVLCMPIPSRLQPLQYREDWLPARSVTLPAVGKEGGRGGQ